MIREFLRRCFTREKITDYHWVKNSGGDLIIITDRASYRGCCTVWFKTYPTFERCSTSKEIWLANFWQKKKWEKENND